MKTEIQAPVYRIRKSQGENLFFKAWDGPYAIFVRMVFGSYSPVFTLDEAEQISGRFPGSIVEAVN
jgi:hypothetical protein